MSQPKDPLIMRYPYAVRILAASSQVDLDLVRVPNARIDAGELAVVRVTADGDNHDVVVDNEYGDADSGHRALLLMLVLMALRDFADDGHDFDRWCREQGIDAPDPELRRLYDALDPARRALTHRFQDLEVPGSHEWSVDSDGVQALRNIARGDF